jgi:DNA-directed RNA polymerase specialized sigma24 family protein
VEFWKKEAYLIASKITGGNPISSDLVSHVYLLVHELSIRQEDLPRVFARYAYNQYNWRDSTFNKLFKTHDELPDMDSRQSDDESYEVTKAQELLDDYLHQSPEDDQKMFTKEITKMHLMGMTYREIRTLTGISLDTIHLAIKQFKYDLSDYNNSSNRICESSPEFQSA